MSDIKDLLKKPIGSNQKAAMKLPSKKTMNLFVHPTDGNSLKVVLPLTLLFIVLFGLFVRFGVMGRMEKLNQLQAESAQLTSQLDAIQSRLENYDAVENDYRRFSIGYLQEDEVGLENRSRVFEIVHEAASGLADIKNINVQGNQVSLVVEVLSLEDMDLLQDRLEAMENISEIMVSTVKGTNNIDVEGSIAFTVKKLESEEAEVQTDSGMSDAERATRYEQYITAAKEAREAKANGTSNAQAESAAAAAVYSGTGSSNASSGSSSSGSTAAGSSGSSTQSTQTAGTIRTQQKTVIPVSPEPQTIGNDQVINDPSQVPAGFNSLAEGMAKLQEATR